MYKQAQAHTSIAEHKYSEIRQRYKPHAQPVFTKVRTYYAGIV